MTVLSDIPERVSLRVVAVLNDRWRVIECPDGIQWIVQKRVGQRHGRTRWEGRRYLRTRTGLIAFLHTLPVESDADVWAVLECLPEWVGEQPSNVPTVPLTDPQRPRGDD